MAFSSSDFEGGLFFSESFQLQKPRLRGGGDGSDTFSFSVAAGSGVTSPGRRSFSVKLMFEPITEGDTDDALVPTTEDAAVVGRARQMSFISFSSNSLHWGTM